MNIDWPIIVAAAVLVTALLSALITYAVMQRRVREMGEGLARLQAELQAMRGS